MGEQVKVADLETLDRLRVALARAAEALDLSLQEAQVEIDRAGAWVEDQRPEELRGQIRKAQDQVVSARSALYNKEMIRATSESRPSVVDERKALARAEARLADLEQRARRCRFWATELGSQRSVFRGGVAPLRTALDRDIPRATALLRHLAAHLEDYARGGDDRDRILSMLVGGEDTPPDAMSNLAPPAPEDAP